MPYAQTALSLSRSACTRQSVHKFVLNTATWKATGQCRLTILLVCANVHESIVLEGTLATAECACWAERTNDMLPRVSIARPDPVCFGTGFVGSSSWLSRVDRSMSGTEGHCRAHSYGPGFPRCTLVHDPAAGDGR